MISNGSVNVQSSFFGLSSYTLAISVVQRAARELYTCSVLVTYVNGFGRLNYRRPALTRLATMTSGAICGLLYIDVSIQQGGTMLFDHVGRGSLGLYRMIGGRQARFMFGSTSSRRLVVLGAIVGLGQYGTRGSKSAGLTVLVYGGILGAIIDRFKVFCVSFASGASFGLQRFVGLCFYG